MENNKDKQIKKIQGFLLSNGWKLDNNQNDEFYTFYHDYNYGIDLSKEDGEIVVIADVGDIFHIQLSQDSIYTLVGFLILNPCDGWHKIYKHK